jgi:hypothetical protein
MKILAKHKRGDTSSAMLVDIDYADDMSMTLWAGFPGWVFYPQNGSPRTVHRRPGGGWWVIEVTEDEFGPAVAGPFPTRRTATAAWKLLTS